MLEDVKRVWRSVKERVLSRLPHGGWVSGEPQAGVVLTEAEVYCSECDWMMVLPRGTMIEAAWMAHVNTEHPQ